MFQVNELTHNSRQSILLSSTKINLGGKELKKKNKPNSFYLPRPLTKCFIVYCFIKSRSVEFGRNTHRWVKDVLSNRTQRVLVDGQSSSEAHVTSGVPEGSALGPLLFLAFINDLPDYVKSSTTRLFVDDTVLYQRITFNQVAIKLQEDLDSLQKWETTWLMEFHPSKVPGCKGHSQA